MGVDFEERVDYRRLHRYRLARARQALEKSDLGSLLVMDVNNIRYLTSTKIGEWERDKICRWALLTRGSADPILWDFGSAARRWRIGRANAAVLPVPVWAMPRTSRPARTTGMAWAWMAVGVS